MVHPPGIRKILLADDSRLCRELLKGDLLGENITVVEANDGQETLDLVARDPPDLILLDVQMPVRNGLSVLLELQANERTRRIPVIMLTGQGNQSVAVEAMKHGAKDYLVKGSVTPENLNHAITNAVQKAALERALDARQHDVDRLAGVVTRDLEAPLGKIVDWCDVLRRELGGAGVPEGERAVEAIAQLAGHLRQLVAARFAYVESERAAAEIAPVDLDEVFAEVLAHLEPAIAQSGAQVELPSLPTVQGNKAALARLFECLVDNAIKFRGRETPRIRVTFEEDGDMWHLAVHDNGVGLDPDQQRELSAPSDTTEPWSAEGGKGLGLATCRAILRKYGGHLWINSALGRGSVFHVMLPAAPTLAAV